MMKVALIGLLAGLFYLSSAELNKDKLMAELKELSRELRVQTVGGDITVGDPEVAEDLPKAPEEDTAEPEEEEEVKVSAIEKLFSKLGGVLGRRLEKVANRYEKRARKVRKIANRISEELDLTVEQNAIEDLASQFENTAEFLRQVAEETEMYFDGADEKLQNIMSRAPSGRHITHLRKKVKAAKNANKSKLENQEPSNAAENTDGDVAVDNGGADATTINVEADAATDTAATDTAGANDAAEGTGTETGENTDAGTKRTLDWLVKELRAA